MAASNKLYRWLQQPISIAPLVVYRILFGTMMGYACLWSIAKDDISERYTSPTFFFKYYGFEWVGYIGDQGIYFLYALWLICALGILLGAAYRLCIWLFFGLFTYLQLLDATNYINHYYAISIFAFLLGLLPANAAYSLDAYCGICKKRAVIPQFYIRLLQAQVAIIYLGAAIAKMNSDWLLRAMPMKAWLLQNQDFPFLGTLFRYHFVHLAASWSGMLFDLSIVFLLFSRSTRGFAYVLVLLFHTFTGLLLNIGLFPLLMILTTTVFFSPQWHQQLLEKWGRWQKEPTSRKAPFPKWLQGLFILHLIIQISLPFRHHLYPSDAMWTEEGYRFAWWVMLVEKEGYAVFYVKDRHSDRRWEVTNQEFLTAFQEKRMSVRPDHILQFAHYLAKRFSKRYDLEKPIVTADVYVTLNGRTSSRLVDPTVNLAVQNRQYGHYEWILPRPPN